MATLTRLDTRQTYPLPRGVTTLGRRATNTIQVDDKQVSRGHCRIEGPKGGWVLYDSGSASGTLVNGRRIQEHHLESGDKIQVGSVVFLFELHLGEPPVPGARLLSNGAAKRLVPEEVVIMKPGRWLTRRRRRRILLALLAVLLAAGAILAWRMLLRE
jgi:pSer/pThr/pTyr-binding forkhead associated (FHA) protein